ncbi:MULTISPECIES: VacJ family lipoprotein [unclassified Shewanella]|uniref:MlaA family lipoprotein n=1 Tax=unclassified Shewanella TaxID=196818 RepID=UPI0006D66B77|nr:MULTISPECIES: VacJ family lipoprotein [unclassified Shewanella]KPZ69879.1 putative phospholipid-binding lipoprotein MlaA precursor [Shewanella sp. P1-14-1]MBQ4891188.1 VacJ family lipoprotein [Shewanella sp. MMG014]OBT10311.1 ABC transporter [Shewanella sp. UCD-FRSSP16_17]
MKYKWMLLSLMLGNSVFLAHAEEASTNAPQATVKPAVEVIYNDPRDPIEGFNRAMWDFNYLVLDRHLFRPIAHGYNDYLPLPVKSGVNNFVRNFEEPSSLVNNALQGKWGWAANAGGRFTVNTTLGLFGIIDVADMMGMVRKQDQFNEVLGYYGVPNGPYFMAPFFGPYVTRELASDWVDGLYFPLSEFLLWQSILKWGLKNLDSRAAAIDQERLLDNALDPYTFVKEAYFQYMDYKVYDGNVPSKQDDDELLEEYLLELE